MQGISVAVIAIICWVYLHWMDVRRLRLREVILARAPPGEPIYQRNLPQRTTRLGFDNAVGDAWSARVLGAWWVWRAMPLLAVVGVIAFMERHVHSGGVITVLAGFAAPLITMRANVHRLQADISMLESQHTI